MEDQECIEKQSVALTCALSKPRLKVQWFKDDEEITENDRIRFAQEGKSYKLVIDNANLSDTGKYILKYNDEVETSCELSVKGKNI